MHWKERIHVIDLTTDWQLQLMASPFETYRTIQVEAITPLVVFAFSQDAVDPYFELLGNIEINLKPCTSMLAANPE